MSIVEPYLVEDSIPWLRGNMGLNIPLRVCEKICFDEINVKALRKALFMYVANDIVTGQSEIVKGLPWMKRVYILN